MRVLPGGANPPVKLQYGRRLTRARNGFKPLGCVETSTGFEWTKRSIHRDVAAEFSSGRAADREDDSSVRHRPSVAMGLNASEFKAWAC
jgi:hypothetical protein